MEIQSEWLAKEMLNRRPNYGYSKTPTIPGLKMEKPLLRERIFAQANQKDTVLWPMLFEAFPEWMWLVQGTGDCVSIGTGHMEDCNAATQALSAEQKKIFKEACTEAIYGFGKAELFRSYRFNSPGMAGIDGVMAIRQYGILHRQVYQHDDCTKYSGKRAIAWGEKPRHTHGVPDYLEPLAAINRSTDCIEVTDAILGAALLESGYAWQWCGNTQWGLTRDANGLANSWAYGAHCMTATGVRYKDGKPWAFWIANTGHGDHVYGPVGPYPMPAAYAACGSWIRVGVIDAVLRQGDCYAVSDSTLWEKKELTPECQPR